MADESGYTAAMEEGQLRPADDKIAAERVAWLAGAQWASRRWTGHEVDPHDFDQMLDELFPAERVTVAPDLRKSVERALFELRGNTARTPESVRAMETLSDALAASESVTVAPDRETLARMFHAARLAKSTHGYPMLDHYEAADALLASGVLGVPADLIRAETLQALIEDHLYSAFYGSTIVERIRARAAEYRKAAGA